MIESERVRASCLALTRQVSTLVVCVLCDWIPFAGEMRTKSPLMAHQKALMSHQKTLMSHQGFLPKWRPPRPFSLWDHCGTSWWILLMAALRRRAGSWWYRWSDLADWGAVSHRRSERRLGLLCCTAAFGRGQRFVDVFDTPAELSCLRQWSCFEFPIPIGAGIGPAYR